jgi:excisionase family DNA binding protein
MEDRMLSLKEVSEIVGVSVRTLRRWFAENTSPIPFYRVGGRFLRARKSDVSALLVSLRDASNNGPSVDLENR